jgi:DNA-binding MarR family transcriptional regulator
VSRTDAATVRVVFTKVAEFQTRGVVHFHAIIRLDGTAGPHTTPPGWATTAALSAAILSAAGRTRLSTPVAGTIAARRLRFGRQLDVQHLNTGGGVSDVAVASYVAKYATKTAEVTGVVLAPLYCRACAGHGTRPRDDGRVRRWCRACSGTGRRRAVDLSELSEHGRALVGTCWRLGALPAFEYLRLRRWAHQLGYRGHVTTKSRTYSTTRGALSARLGSLVAAGLVTRARDIADQRRVHVTLTRAAYLAFARHVGSEGAGEEALLSALSARERATLAKLLRKVVLAIENPSPMHP